MSAYVTAVGCSVSNEQKLLARHQPIVETKLHLRAAKEEEKDLEQMIRRAPNRQ